METDNNRLTNAVIFAAEKHAGQSRKDGTAYIYHPMHVAEILKDAGYSVEYQIAGVLHDVLEDTDATEEEVACFGEDVLHAVLLVTRPDGMDEDVYVDRIITDPIAKAVKNADKIHNLQEAVSSVRASENRNKQSLRFAQYYLKKSKQYYKGKFSRELDALIDRSEDLLSEYSQVNS
jgi:(p)ppGpp synthase/HD superfamily hydrolase